MENNVKYNYVIFGAPGFYEVAYHDVIKQENVLFLTHFMDSIRSSFWNFMVRITFSPRTNRYFSYPLKWLTFPHVLSMSFKEERPICFLFFGVQAPIFHSPYFDFLKRHYPNARFVLYMQDIVARNPHLDMQRAREQFDVILSYDKGDCRKYDLIYYPTPYSTFTPPEDDSIPESDIYFCGKGKDRYPLIHSIYEQCKMQGLVCDFYVSDMLPSAPHINGIHYNEPLSYIQNLQHVTKTKCILEIMQTGADGFTPRVWESLFYNKHLLTNNNAIISSPYFRKDFTHLVDSGSESIAEWISHHVEDISSETKVNLSPRQLLNQIETIFIIDKL